MNKHGFTLAEVIVAGSVSLLLLALVLSCWTLASRGWSRTYSMQSAQQETMIPLGRLQQDFRRANPEAIHLQGDTLSFLSSDNGDGSVAWDSTGEVLWRCWVQYRWRDGLVRRRQVDLTPSSSPPEPVPPWPDNAPSHIVARGLESWQWTVRGAALDVAAECRREREVSAVRLQVMPFLYQSD